MRKPTLMILLLGLLWAPLAAAQLWRGPAALEVRAEGGRGTSLAGGEVKLTYLALEPPDGPAPVPLDAKGRAVIGGLAEGLWHVEVSREGFMTFQAEVDVRQDGKPDVRSTLQLNVPRAVHMMEVRFARARSAPAALARPAGEPAARAQAPSRPARRVPAAPAPESAPPPEASPEPAAPEPAAPPSEPAVARPAPPQPAPQEVPPVPEPAPAPPVSEQPAPVRPEPAPAPPAAPEEEPAAPQAEVPAPRPAPPQTAPSAPAPQAPAPTPPAPTLAPPPTSPSVEPAPAAPATPVMRRRSFDDRTCFECKPGEAAVSVEQVVPAGEAAAGCGAELRDHLGKTDGVAALPPGCRALRIELPAGLRYIGYRYEVQDGEQTYDCQAGQDCQAGAGRWPIEPVMVRSAAGTIITTAFESRGSSREKRAILTAYYTAATGTRRSPRSRD